MSKNSQEQGISLDERDQIVINGATEYAQKAFEYDKENKYPEAIELYQRAIYLLENESASIPSNKREAYKIYTEIYNARIQALQLQIQKPPQSFSTSIMSQEPDTILSPTKSVLGTEEKALTNLIEDLDNHQTTLQVLRSSLLILTKGGRLTKNLYVPSNAWFYAFEEDDNGFFKEALQFYQEMSNMLSKNLDDERVKSREVDLEEIKARLIEFYKAFRGTLLEIITHIPVVIGKATTKGNKIEEYANFLKKNLAKLKPQEEIKDKKIAYAQFSENTVQLLIDLIEYVEDEHKFQRSEILNKDFKEFIYAYCRDFVIKILLYDIKLKMSIYFLKNK